MEDLDSWLREFDRVVKHVSAGQGLLPEDRIAHMLASWPAESLVGENLRLVQASLAYQRLELDEDLESCWEMILRRLRTFAVQPAVARWRAQDLWRNLYWPGDIDQFHTVLDRCLAAHIRNHIPKAEDEVVLRYLELVPPAFALHCEHPSLAPPGGWALGPLRQTAKDYFSLQQVYGARNEGGKPKNRAVRAEGDGSETDSDRDVCQGQGHKPAL